MRYPYSKDRYLRINLTKEMNVKMSLTLVERSNSTRFISLNALMLTSLCLWFYYKFYQHNVL